jgi:hypothetical protein
MLEITATCDRCGHKETQQGKRFDHKKNGWRELYLSDSPDYNSHPYRHDLKEYLFCANCSKALGFRNDTKIFAEENGTLADKLIEVIVEIIQEQTQT